MSDQAREFEVPTLESVYRAHREYVWRTVRRLGASEAEAEDAVHDTFLVVARRLGEFRGDADLKTWLFAVALRVVKNQRRGASRKQRREAAYAEEPRKTADSGSFRQVEQGELLYALLGRLPETQRVVFVLAELEGRSAPEIAEVTGLKTNTVYSRLRTARATMAKAADHHRKREAREREGAS